MELDLRWIHLLDKPDNPHSKEAYIDSRHRDGAPSDFTFQLPQGVSTDNTMGIVLSQLP